MSTVESDNYIWTPLTREDIHDVYMLLDTVNRSGDTDYDVTEDDLMRQFDDPWSDPKQDSRVIRTKQGEVIGFLRIYANPKPIKENFAIIWNIIAPQVRGRHLEEIALTWIEARACQRLGEIISQENTQKWISVIRTEMSESAKEFVQVYINHEFMHVRSFFKMRRDLKESILRYSLPKNLILRTYSEDLDEPLRQAVNASFYDHWGYQEITQEEWHPFIMDASDVCRDLTLVAMENDEVVAFCINHVKMSENERRGFRCAWINSIGTRPEWRNRGIASALITESMQRFLSAGFDYAEIKVDADNSTGALKLYERLGFKTYKTFIDMEKKIIF